MSPRSRLDANPPLPHDYLAADDVGGQHRNERGEQEEGVGKVNGVLEGWLREDIKPDVPGVDGVNHTERRAKQEQDGRSPLARRNQSEERSERYATGKHEDVSKLSPKGRCCGNVPQDRSTRGRVFQRTTTHSQLGVGEQRDERNGSGGQPQNPLSGDFREEHPLETQVAEPEPVRQTARRYGDNNERRASYDGRNDGTTKADHSNRNPRTVGGRRDTSGRLYGTQTWKRKYLSPKDFDSACGSP